MAVMVSVVAMGVVLDGLATGVLVVQGLPVAVVVGVAFCWVMAATEGRDRKAVRELMEHRRRHPELPAPTEAMVLAVLAVVMVAPAAGSLAWLERVAAAEQVVLEALEVPELQVLTA